MAPTAEENKEAPAASKSKKSAKQRLLEQVTSLSSDDDDRQAASKKISWILRHGTRKVNLKPDDDGFIKVADLLKVEILDDLSKEKFLSVIAESNAQKPRYHLKDGPDGQLIAALNKEARKIAKGEAAARVAAPAADSVAKKTSVKDGERATMRGDAPVFIPSGVPSATNPYAQNPYGYGYPYGGMPPMMSPMASYGAYPSFGAMMSQKGMEAGRFRGRIKSFNTEKGFGFIDCAQAHAQYGRDVFLHKAHVGDMAVGTEVTFVVEMNKQGMPQARDLVTVSSAGKGAKGKGKDGKGKGDKSKGKDRGEEGGKKKEGKGKKKKEEKKAEGEAAAAPAKKAEGEAAAAPAEAVDPKPEA